MSHREVSQVNETVTMKLIGPDGKIKQESTVIDESKLLKIRLVESLLALLRGNNETED